MLYRCCRLPISRGPLLVSLLLLALACPSWEEEAGAGRDGLVQAPPPSSCPPAAPVAVPIDSPSARVESMWVTRTKTPNSFWMALPNEDAEPGYLSNSGRATGIINPSGSVLLNALLGGPDGCSRRDAEGRPPLVVDVGAHVGWFTLLAASYGCRVVAFEPQPHANTFLNASIALNAFSDRVTLVRAAVSDGGGSVKMVNTNGWNNWDITEMVEEGDEREGLVVPSVRVDDYVDEDLILFKVDAEGAEDAVLRSAKGLLERRGVGAFLIESKSSGGGGSDSFKRGWFQHAVDSGYAAYEFYEEVGRSVWRWHAGEHVFPIQRVPGFGSWPGDQEFEDHILIKSEEMQRLLEAPAASVEFPPQDHRFRQATKVGIVTATRGLEDGELLVLYVNEIEAGAADNTKGVGLGHKTRYISWMMPVMSDGSYTARLTVRSIEGDEASVGSEVSFEVDSGGASQGRVSDSERLRWHCERFFGLDFCS